MPRGLLQTRMKLFSVSGTCRRDAAPAMLNGGLATHLCLDKMLGCALLDAPVGTAPVNFDRRACPHESPLDHERESTRL